MDFFWDLGVVCLSPIVFLWLRDRSGRKMAHFVPLIRQLCGHLLREGLVFCFKADLWRPVLWNSAVIRQ